MAIIEIENLCFSYNQDIVLDNLNMKLLDGDIAMIIGANGSGKSTLLKLLLGELKPTKGSIKLFGEPIESFKDFQRIGYVPQIQVSSQMAFPITCLELVVQNRYRFFGNIKIPRKEDLELAKEALIEMSLGEYINTPVKELSGGLKQRTMIARAFLNKPDLLVLDEPTAGVDENSKRHLLESLEKVGKKSNTTILIVTHEPEDVQKNIEGTKIFNLKGGKIC